MTRIVFLALTLVAVAGCSTGRDLPQARGPWVQLNAEKWTATPTDLAAPEARR